MSMETGSVSRVIAYLLLGLQDHFLSLDSSMSSQASLLSGAAIHMQEHAAPAQAGSRADMNTAAGEMESSGGPTLLQSLMGTPEAGVDSSHDGLQRKQRRSSGVRSKLLASLQVMHMQLCKSKPARLLIETMTLLCFI